MSDLDKLMEKYARDYDDDDIIEIISYVRKQLAMYDSGVKPKRKEAENLDMAAIIANITKAKGTVAPSRPTKAPSLKRRI